MTDISQFSGWAAIAYIVIKDVLVPIVQKQIPSRQKQQDKQLEHQQLMEEKRLEAELGFQKQVADAVLSIKDVLATNNERLSHIETDVKDIKAEVIKKRTRKVS